MPKMISREKVMAGLILTTLATGSMLLLSRYNLHKIDVVTDQEATARYLLDEALARGTSEEASLATTRARLTQVNLELSSYQTLQATFQPRQPTLTVITTPRP